MAKMWHKEDGMDPVEIGGVLLDDDAIDAIVAHLDHMIVTADGEYEDTADKLRRHARVGFTTR